MFYNSYRSELKHSFIFIKYLSISNKKMKQFMNSHELQIFIYYFYQSMVRNCYKQIRLMHVASKHETIHEFAQVPNFHFLILSKHES